MLYLKAKRRKNGLWIVEFIVFDNSVTTDLLNTISNDYNFSFDDSMVERDEKGDLSYVLGQSPVSVSLLELINENRLFDIKM